VKNSKSGHGLAKGNAGHGTASGGLGGAPKGNSHGASVNPVKSTQVKSNSVKTKMKGTGL